MVTDAVCLGSAVAATATAGRAYDWTKLCRRLKCRPAAAAVTTTSLSRRWRGRLSAISFNARLSAAAAGSVSDASNERLGCRERGPVACISERCEVASKEYMCRSAAVVSSRSRIRWPKDQSEVYALCRGSTSMHDGRSLHYDSTGQGLRRSEIRALLETEPADKTQKLAHLILDFRAAAHAFFACNLACRSSELVEYQSARQLTRRFA